MTHPKGSRAPPDRRECYRSYQRRRASVIGHIKDEEVWAKEYIDFQDALSNLGQFLDVEYNHHRIHSALDYLTPAEFEARHEEQE